MSRYFLHLRDGTDELLDLEGIELPSFEALREKVLAAARDVIAGDLHNGIIDLRCRIEAANEKGEIVYVLPFKHAFSIIPDTSDS